MIEHLSVSSMQTYMQCPRKWKFRYLDRVPAKVSTNLVFGSAFHNTIEKLIVGYDTKSRGDLWQEMWTARIDGNNNIDWGDTTQEDLFEQGLKMLQTEETQGIISAIEPLEMQGEYLIEQRFDIEVPGVGVPVIGYIDVIEVDGVPADFKTSARKWNDDKALAEIQPLMYIKAMQQLFGYRRHDFRYYVFVKNGKAQTFNVQFTQSQIDWFVVQLRGVWKGIMAEVFPAGCQMGWWCNKKYCEYYDHCGR